MPWSQAGAPKKDQRTDSNNDSSENVVGEQGFIEETKLKNGSAASNVSVAEAQKGEAEIFNYFSKDE